jgi:hypothetical protein
MIFYRTPDGAWHATQAAARAIDRRFEQVEVPTDKPGLLEFLNQKRGSDTMHEAGAAASEDPVDIEMMEPAVPPEAALNPVNMSADELAQLLGPAVERLGELGEEGFDALEAHQQSTGVGAAFSRGVHILTVVAAGQHQLMRILSRRRKWGG